MNSNKYQLPLIHLNGNNGHTLLDQYQNTLEAASNLRDLMSKIEFHPRDYYPLGNDAYAIARNQRDEILIKLNEIEDYLTEHSIHIHNHCN